MTTGIQNASSAGAIAQTRTSGDDPKAIARQILAETDGKPATYDRLGQIEARIDAIERTDPNLAAKVRAEVMASPSLTRTQKAELERNAPGRTVDLDGKLTQRFSSNGIDQDQWINGQRANNTSQYQALVRLAGSAENGPIKQVLNELYQRGLTADQLETARANEASAKALELAVDLGQIALDIIGIFDQTGISDGANALISAGRGDWVGAGLSLLSAIPLVGDLAKAGKLGKWAETVAKAVDLAISNPAVRKMLEPALQKLNDALKAIPDSVMRNLPDSLRKTLEGMKTKLDELFGAVQQSIGRMVGDTFVIDANKGLTFTAGGKTHAIGDAPTVTTLAGGKRVTKDLDGNEVTVRGPKTFESQAPNELGGTTYTKNGISVKYDANGFPVFDSKADIYLDPKHINSGNADDHFRASNEALGKALSEDPSLAGKLGLTDDQVKHLTKSPPSADPPPDFTWHHHQDSGRMQLVSNADHFNFPGGHTGGMRLWGGGY